MNVVIVGGGIIGTAIASRLGESGHDVTLLERSALGRETTAASAGIVMHTAVDPTPFELRFRAHARSVYRRLFDRGPLEWTRTGALYVAETPTFADRLEESAALLRERGVEASFLPAADLGEFGLSCEGFAGALHTPGDRLCDPTAVARWFAGCARGCGADVRTGVEVTDVVTRDGNVAAVDTEDGPIEADRVINATGPWAPRLNELAGVSLPLSHTLGPMAALETGADEPIESPVTILESKRYVRPERGADGEGTGAWIGEYRTEYVEGQRYDPAALEVPADFAAAATDLAAVVPALEGATVREEWIGLRTVTPDGLPIVGETAVDGYLVACGMTGQGVTLAPAVADHVRGLLEGSADEEYRERHAPDRF